MTEYIILRNEADQVTWVQHDTAVASSAGRAIAASLDKGGGAGDYVAVPVRSWRPLTVKVEQTTKVTIG